MKTVEFDNEFGGGHYHEISDDKTTPFQKLQFLLVEGSKTYVCLMERKHDLEDRDNPDRYRVVTGITVQLQELAEVVARLREDERDA